MVGYPVIFFVKLDLGILVDCVIVYIFDKQSYEFGFCGRTIYYLTTYYRTMMA